MNIITLRCHHTICIQLYKGLGYDDIFCKKMHEIVNALNKSPDTLIKLVFSADDLCAVCPNHTADGCGHGEDAVREMDRAAAEIIGMTGISAYKNIQKSLSKRISEEGFCRCCQNCSWYAKGVCSYEMLEKKL